MDDLNFIPYGLFDLKFETNPRPHSGRCCSALIDPGPPASQHHGGLPGHRCPASPYQADRDERLQDGCPDATPSNDGTRSRRFCAGTLVDPTHGPAPNDPIASSRLIETRQRSYACDFPAGFRVTRAGVDYFPAHAIAARANASIVSTTGNAGSGPA